MATQIPNFYTINGVIDTSKSVLENMNLIAEAAGCWMTYDITQGKWAVVINGTGSSVATFNDSNILGSLNVQSTSLTEVYNSVEMEFPHKDLVDEPDYVRLSIAAGNRYPNEPDNVLSLNSQLINNQAQAQSIAGRALKQSRVEKTINFQADYSYIGLKAGELISVSNTVYGFNNKLFRITSISEEDADDGNIIMNITAVEYDAGVYSTADLQITPRQRQTGITADYLNTAITQANKVAAVSQLGGSNIPVYDSTSHAFLTASIQELYDYWLANGTPDYYAYLDTTPVANLATVLTTTPMAQSTNFVLNTLDYNLAVLGNYIWHVNVEIPMAQLTYSGQQNRVHMPFYVAVFQADFLPNQPRTAVPPNANFTLVRMARATTRSQNVIFHTQNALDGYYKICLIPAPDIGSSYANTVPSARGDIFDDGVACCTASAYVFSTFDSL